MTKKKYKFLIPKPAICKKQFLIIDKINNTNYVKNFIEEIYKINASITKKIALLEFKHSLIDAGFNFQSDTTLLEFINDRVTQLAFINKINYYEFYLDFVNSEQMGTFLFSSDNNVCIIDDVNNDSLTIMYGS